MVILNTINVHLVTVVVVNIVVIMCVTVYMIMMMMIFSVSVIDKVWCVYMQKIIRDRHYIYVLYNNIDDSVFCRQLNYEFMLFKMCLKCLHYM